MPRAFVQVTRKDVRALRGGGVAVVAALLAHTWGCGGAPGTMGSMTSRGDEPSLSPAMSSVAAGTQSDRAQDPCGLDSGFLGDEYCLAPPPPDRGFQVHVGPRDYGDPDPTFLLGPGEEITTDHLVPLGNDRPIYIYYRQYRQRPGTHHNVLTTVNALTQRLGVGGLRIGTTNRVVEDNPPGGVPAPENRGVGVPIEAHATVNINLHSVNPTDEPLLREAWVNFWYVDEDKVTQVAQQLFAPGDVSFAIGPREETVLGPYRCDIEASGRLLWFYGHRHANNVRFSAWRVRGDRRDLFYLGLDWEQPMVLQFASTVTNPVPDLLEGMEGGWSGILDVQAGDQLVWECHVINQHDTTLRFTNNTYTGEMCIMDGEFVGTNCLQGSWGAPPE